MATSPELSRFAAFAELPVDQIEWFLGQSKEVNLKAGEVYVRQGDPPNWLFVLRTTTPSVFCFPRVAVSGTHPKNAGTGQVPCGRDDGSRP